MAEERRPGWLGVVEEFSHSEVGFTFMGVLFDSIIHMITESALDRILESYYPDNYPLYSTLVASGAFTAAGIGIAAYGHKVRYPVLQYVGWGMVFSEISSWLDMVRVSFELRTT